MKPKYSTQFKLKVVRYFLDGHAGQGGTAQHFGVSRTHAIRWIQLYLHHGEEALRPRSRSRSQMYSPEFKREVVTYAINHPETSARLAARFGIASHTTVDNWLKRFRLKGYSAFCPTQPERSVSMPVNPDKPRKADDKTPEELLKELEYLRAENDYLKTLQGILLEKKRLESLKKQRR